VPVKSPDSVPETVAMVRVRSSSSPRACRGRFFTGTGLGLLFAAVFLFRALSRERVRVPQTCREWPETEAFTRQAAKALAAMDALDWRWTLAGQGTSAETDTKA